MVRRAAWAKRDAAAECRSLLLTTVRDRSELLALSGAAGDRNHASAGLSRGTWRQSVSDLPGCIFRKTIGEMGNGWKDDFTGGLIVAGGGQGFTTW